MPPSRVLGELVARFLAEHEAAKPTAPRRARCERCGGTGTVPTEAGTVLLDFLRRHLAREPQDPPDTG